MSSETEGVCLEQEYDQAASMVPETSKSTPGPGVSVLVPVDFCDPDIRDGPPLVPQPDLNPPTSAQPSAPPERCSPSPSSNSHMEHIVSSEPALDTVGTSRASYDQDTDKPDSIPEKSSGVWPPHRGYAERQLKRKRDETDATERVSSPAAPQIPSNLERRNQELARKLRTASRYIQTLKEQCATLDAHYQAARHALETEQALRQDDLRLLDIRAQELQSAEAFLSKADVYSCSEVHHLVQSLNNEIFQISAQITDSVLAKEDMSPSTKVSQAEKMREAYDDRILTLLRSEDKDVQACMLQEAVQSVFANVAAEFIDHWDIDPVRHQMLVQLYQGMQTTNSAVSGRWRALTRAQNKYGLSANPELLYTRFITSSVIRILRFAGHRVNKEEFKLTFGKNISDFGTLLIKVDRAIGEGVTSQDLAVFLPSAGSIFDTKTMIDENAEDGATELEVAFSTKLGLKSTTITADSDVRAEVVLGKASVLLYATLAKLQNE